MGNDFLNVLEPYAAKRPFQSVCGNHERADNFTQYKSRFSGNELTAAASTSTSPLWYSFNHGLVHFVMIDTEIFEYGGGDVQAQYDWLERDIAAVDRATTPWVVAAGHKTRFMGGTDFSRFDVLFKTMQVDLYVAGHAHNYQRIAPNDNGVREACLSADNRTYTDCANYVAVVSGSPGNREIEAKPDNAKAPASVLDVFDENYGFSHLTAVDAHTLLFEFEETRVRGGVEGAFRDSFSIIKTGHARKPTGVAFDATLPLGGDLEL